MPIQLEKEKWILYKHTNSYEMIKVVALDVKNHCGTDLSETEKFRMQERLTAIDFYKTRNPGSKCLDSMNHRINTLEFFMFGYETIIHKTKRFIFSPLGNLYLKYIQDNEKLPKIFASMLFAIQFQHYANGTPSSIQLYPFRLIFKLLLDPRLDFKLHFAEYAYFIAELHSLTPAIYEELVRNIINFRLKPKDEIVRLMKENEHYFVVCVYEWQYYITSILQQAGVIDRIVGEEIVKLYHPQKEKSTSNPTGRKLCDGFISLKSNMESFVSSMLSEYSCFAPPISLSDGTQMQMDIVKEIYSFYPKTLLSAIGEVDEIQEKLLSLPKLIEAYSNNPEGETAYLFEDVLEEGFNMFYDVEAHKIGGAGHTDIECLYLTKHKKFAVEAKSTHKKLIAVNPGRLRVHRKEIGGDYTIVITPRYMPAVKSDIKGENIVILLAHTFSEYLYNHIYHDKRDMMYSDFDNIIAKHLGEDISKLISDITIEKFSTHSSFRS